MTRKTLIVIGVVVVVVIAAFLLGYWPEHQRGASLQTDNDAFRARIVSLENRARLSVIHVKALDAIDAVAAMNYGHAQGLSSSLFDDMRVELSRTTEPPYREALQEGLNRRDAITAALAIADASALEGLRELEKRIRQVLSTPVAASLAVPITRYFAKSAIRSSNRQSDFASPVNRDAHGNQIASVE